jgi:nitrate reductase delta subunit
MITLRALGALLTYPGVELRSALPEIEAAIEASSWIEPRQRQRLAELTAMLRDTDPFDLEERYVELFDRTRSLSLHLFEHVHGDSRDRGAAMVDLQAIYARAGLRLRPGELPDYLPAVLEYTSCRSPEEARDMLADCAHVLRDIGKRLAARGSRYAAVFDALLVFVGEAALEYPAAPAPAEPLPNVDESWMDAPAFGPEAHSAAGTEASSPSISAIGRAATSATELPLRYMPRYDARRQQSEPH